MALLDVGVEGDTDCQQRKKNVKWAGEDVSVHVPFDIYNSCAIGT